MSVTLSAVVRDSTRIRIACIGSKADNDSVSSEVSSRLESRLRISLYSAGTGGLRL